MRCPDCDYPLWNIKARECPECGRPFRPSEFDFIPDAVRFCCPACDTAYYGTGERGQLVPDAFECVRCARPIDMDRMVLRPAEGVHEEQTKVEAIPWLEREQRGVVRSWLKTVWYGMVAPHKIGSGLRGPLRPVRALWFLAFTMTVLVAVGAALPLLGISLIMVLSGDPSGTGPAIAGVIIALTIGIAFAIFTLLWSLTTHGMLRLTGGAPHTLGRTVEATCFCCGPLAILAIPCLGPYCGSYIGSVWWIVAACIAVATGQQVHGGRATLAVLTFPTLLVAAIVVAYGGFFFFMFPNMMARASGAANAARNQVTVASIVSAFNEAAGADGAGPAHAVELLETGVGSPTMFVLATSTTVPDEVPVGDTNLFDLSMLPDNRRRAAIDAIVAAQPADVVAHRLGDFVFTYHGVDLADADPGLWIAVGVAERGSEDPDAMIVVAQVDGRTTAFPPESLPERLAAQNAIRAENGLPALPDPSTVTHARPAVRVDDR